MYFEPNTIYHIYNQGNNRQLIFYQEENYLFFLKKMRTYLLPYGDLLCYCLMPNHFHWLFYVRVVELPRPTHQSVGVTASHPDTDIKPLTLNESIGILLRSYTRAVNKQQKRSGALFREETKAKDGWEDPHLLPNHPRYQKRMRDWEIYGTTCFNYIHENPVEAKLVATATDWVYSSCRDYAGLRQGVLCNKILAKELLVLP